MKTKIEITIGNYSFVRSTEYTDRELGKIENYESFIDGIFKYFEKIGKVEEKENIAIIKHCNDKRGFETLELEYLDKVTGNIVTKTFRSLFGAAVTISSDLLSYEDVKTIAGEALPSKNSEELLAVIRSQYNSHLKSVGVTGIKLVRNDGALVSLKLF